MEGPLAVQPALAQLTQRFHEVNFLKGDMLSSGEATTHYSSSESSSGADNLNGQMDSGSLLDSFPGMVPRQSDGARSSVTQEGKAQICFDFTKGVCSRGDKCKYSHDLATIVHFNSKEKGICFDYLRNQCHRGLLCRFSHDLSNIAQQCQVYNNGAKDNKGTKPNAICYDFVKGVCQRGAECRYSHDLSLIARMARGGSAQPKTSEVCYDYLRGRCNRGTTCKYSHNISFLAAPGFLGSAMAADGAPLAVQAQGVGMAGPGAPMTGIMPGAPGMPISGMPGLGPRLSNGMSADQATLNALAAAGNGAMNQMFAAQAAAAEERRRRSGSIAGDMGNDTLNVNDQPGPWPGMPAGHKALAMAQHAAMLSSFAAQQRAAHAAAAAQFHAYGQLPQPFGMQGPGGMGMGQQTDTGALPPYGRPASMTGFGQDTGAGMGRMPMPSPQFSPELAAFLAGGMPENPGLLAETLAAAKAQNARMMAAAATAGGPNAPAMMQSGAMLRSMGSGGGAPSSSGSGAPQTATGHEGMGASIGYDESSSGYGSNSGPLVVDGSQSGGGAPPENMSRSAPAGGPGGPSSRPNVNSDLLPMIKEIWSKPGAA